MDKNSLHGKKILITRAREQSSEFSTRLRNLGAEVIEFPTIEILPPRSWKGLDRAIDRLKSLDWIIFTSVNGVNFFLQRLADQGGNRRILSSLRICAIGPATAKKLKEKRIRVAYIPKEFIAESILEGLKKMDLKGKRILLARAEKARDILPIGLKKMGAEVDVVEAYRTVKPRGGTRRLRSLLVEGKIDVITFTSSSTVNYFSELLNTADLKKLLKGIAVACIGPITAKTAQKWGLRIHIQPEQFTIPGLTQAIEEYFSPHPPPLPQGERAGVRGTE
jgi:uroporphyrinogen III methyltransferase/synthase